MTTISPAVNTEQDRRTRWLDERRTAVTATDAAAIVGVSSYATPLDVYLEKVGERPEIVQTERMEAGNRMQRPIIDWWAERAGVMVEHADPFTFQRSKELSRIGASLDARLADGSRSPVDAKNIGWKTAEWGEEGSDQIPLAYAVQLAVQMYVTRTTTAYLPVLFGGNELVAFVLHRDPELEAGLVDQMTSFWTRYVETRTPPPIDGSAAWTDYLQRTFTSHTDLVVHATPELSSVALSLKATIEQRKLAETEEGRLKNKLRLAIGEGYAAEGPNWRCTWGLTKDSTGTDWEAVAKALALDHAQVTGKAATKMVADLVAKHQVVTKKGSRRFTFSMRDL